jgi:hypothetical protein
MEAVNSMTRLDDLVRLRDAAVEAVEMRVDIWSNHDDLSDWVKPAEIILIDLAAALDATIALIAQEDDAEKWDEE